MNTFLAGEKVVLRSLELEDLDMFWTWFADREVVRYSMGTWLFPWSKKETEQWLQQTLQDKDTLTLGVVKKDGSQLIGYAGIASISRINHSGEYYIFLGEKSSWGQGYGTEATQLIVHYGIASLNLHRIMLTVSSLNTGGIKAYTRAGFQQEGILRDACYRDGAYHDKIVMSILRPEWEAQRS
ncbi:N-acetyltransferase [Ktedonobacter sp. SOSP1-85]|uniref:GNAT family N-acetyltransferase n=1 Tax=Ktedonobacter sp. SOSP1-85 TaxID=2778367 RepID=UPI0019153F3B|nr:GNAT family protein [Ktedonobacter sp. SOSP1-85]GHO77196.1 N-acetyltransferase [Ktedonobacter sp. SOSP1-85]